MIQGTNRSGSEQAYREVYLDSSSSLKDFSLDRKKYFRKYIMSETVDDDEKENQAIKMGKLVETLLMEPELFDEKFYMSACASPPTAMMLDFVEGLYKVSKAATNEEGIVLRPFDELAQEAYVLSGYKIPLATVLNKFIGSDAEIYYDEIRRVRAKRLTVVVTQDVTNAEKIVEELKTNQFIKDVVNLIPSVRYDVLNQLQVEGFSIDGHLFKAMMDKIIIDNVERRIFVYDLKCVWAVEKFYEEYYLYRRAYIQAYVYWRAAIHLTEDPNSKYYKYSVECPKFIVCDSTNYYSPLIYTTNALDLKEAYEGFEYKGRKYPGVREIIKDIKWTLEFNIWNMSRENYLSKGVINIKDHE